jgi:hypothetical protein
MPTQPPEINTTADLKALQRLMSSALFQRLDAHDDLAAQAPNGMDMTDFAEQFIKPNDRMSAFDRLEIYAKQYWFRLLDSLYEDYPGLRALLGETKFMAVCEAYLAKYPSASWTLRNLGSRLVTFLQEAPALTGKKQAMAIAVARFEWAQTLAFDEPSKRPVAGGSLLGSDPATLRLHLQPYLSLLALDYAVDKFFLAVRQQEAGMRSASSNAKMELEARPQAKRVAAPKPERIWLVVHRFENQIYLKRIPLEAYLMLSNLRSGQPLGPALERALADADPTQDWSTAVRGWFEEFTMLGWFCK